MLSRSMSTSPRRGSLANAAWTARLDRPVPSAICVDGVFDVFPARPTGPTPACRAVEAVTVSLASQNRPNRAALSSILSRTVASLFDQVE